MSISKFPLKPRSLRPRIFVNEVPLIDLDAAMRTGTPDAVNLIWDAELRHVAEPIGEGCLSIQSNGETHLGHVAYKFFRSDENIELTHAYFNVSTTHNGAILERFRFSCPGCNRNRSHLYHLNNLWKCRTCQGLLYTSQYKADVEPDFVLYDRLMVESRRQRQPYERRDVFQRRIAAAQAKLAKLGSVEQSRDYFAQRPPSITTSYLRGYDPD